MEYPLLVMQRTVGKQREACEGTDGAEWSLLEDLLEPVEEATKAMSGSL